MFGKCMFHHHCKKILPFPHRITASDERQYYPCLPSDSALSAWLTWIPPRLVVGWVWMDPHGVQSNPYGLWANPLAILTRPHIHVGWIVDKWMYLYYLVR
jgi:hypothetical protein